MKRRVWFAFALFGAFSLAAPAADTPNVVVVMCDDLGYADVGFNGARDIPTPVLDRLAANGTICTSGYVTHPFCGPSRAGLMTGLYPHEYGAQFNLPRNSDTVVGFGVSLEETFLSKVLQDAGYYTGIIGKWHLGAAEGYQPTRRGFDEFYGFRGGGHKYFPERFHAAYDKQVAAGTELIVDNICPLEQNDTFVRETEYLTDAFSREAVRFVRAAHEKEKPFFLYLAYNAPHAPVEALESDIAVCSHIADEKRRTYAAMVYAVDRGVGELVDALKETDAFDNTVIVFLSDNGGKLQNGSDNGPLAGEKGDTTEGGYRVPMFFHWPNHVPAAQLYPHPVTTLDFYPTFAALCGAAIPNGKRLEGKNIWEGLLTGKNARAGEAIFAMRHRGSFTDVGVRRDQWKATRAGQRWALYNLEQDLGEQHDLSAQYPERLRDLVAEAKAWSQRHVQPLWFDAEAVGTQWQKSEMPHFRKTFQAD